MSNCNTGLMGSVLYGIAIRPPMSVAGISNIPGADIDIEQEMRKTMEVPRGMLRSAIRVGTAVGIMEMIMASDSKFGEIIRTLQKEIPLEHFYDMLPGFNAPQHKRRRNQTLAYHRRIQKKWNKRWGHL